VLVVLDAGAAWSRGILRGFMLAAREHAWNVLHYHPFTDLLWLVQQWAPAAVVVGPASSSDTLERLPRARLVSVTVDRSTAGIASVCPDDAAIAGRALEHLLATGLRSFSTFRFDNAPFAVTRERVFRERARATGAQLAESWGSGAASTEQRGEDPSALLAWLQGLPKPCGIFTCTDSWGSALSRYVRAAGLRVPEDIALVGADDDTFECELASPPLTSVMVPWQELGRTATELVQLALSGRSIAGKVEILPPIGVKVRRSSEVFAVADPLVAKAVRWIRANAEQRLTVTMVARAVGGGRQRLERRFRAALDRTVHDEIRRAHVDVAKSLLETTDTGLPEVAKYSGFTNAALLNAAFQRELGMPPGLYRRRMQQQLGQACEE
jgi:LacI family transcriptional regulator